MQATIRHNNQVFTANLDQPIDISIPLRAGPENVNAWYVGPVRIEPVRNGDFVGEVAEGGVVNFRDIAFNPHGNGTHTECLGHITAEHYSVNQQLIRFFFLAELISVVPESFGEDRIITLQQVQDALGSAKPQALVLRTDLNDDQKINRQYSNTNPAYLAEDAAKWIRDLGVDHLLIDLPSVDREEDGGQLLAHRAFWNYPESPRTQATITELIFVPDHVADGSYLLNLGMASFENDATPSKPVLYSVQFEETAE